MSDQYACHCLCGRSFAGDGALAMHKRTCKGTKRRIESVLGNLKGLWDSNTKKRCRNNASSVSNSNSIAESSSYARQNRNLPLRFRVPLPQPLPPVVLPADPDPPVALESTPPPTVPETSRHSLLRQRFTTRRNIFGLFRRYFSSEPPSHDPEEFIGLQDLSEEHLQRDREPPPTNVAPGSLTVSAFYPYPNESSFQLGDWYWKGAQKSQESFSRLVNIISNPTFRPEDIQGVSWSKINTALASDPEGDSGIEWLDEVAGWKRTPIKILVPFHSRAKSRGPKEYIAGELFHRSLVSILREKLSNPEHAEGFHYEPFELFWQPGDQSTKTRVHGELYTSRAFARAHQELLNSKMEPDCNLPRAIASALLHTSRATRPSFRCESAEWPVPDMRSYRYGYIV
ncbi:hypothetical protein FIBSPDRAFT_737822 [Athelia psychrophila]|uniref:C2H2-type domain-containing protein n=1 Tax=Athelia psychrophila TaxID=1759441 RepID=A0A166LQT6_9AGAM|nr:hypothetical protein FIBSPDRAFT_737822 [Fibularhizoctonia sp. CBS 109695]